MSSTSTLQKILNTSKSSSFLADQRWPDPENSIGDPIFSDGRYTYWLSTGLASAHYSKIWKKIRDLLSGQEDYLNSGLSVVRPLMISLYMIGHRPAAASPTIVFICELKKLRRRAMGLVKKEEVLSEYPGFRLAEAAYPPGVKWPMRLFGGDGVMPQRVANASGNLAGDGGGKVKTDYGEYRMQKVAYRIGLTECERSVGIPISVFGSSTMPRRATMGGIISYGGKAFGVTVAHAFPNTKQPFSGLTTYKTDSESEPETLNLEFSFDDEPTEEELEATEEIEGMRMDVDDREETTVNNSLAGMMAMPVIPVEQARMLSTEDVGYMPTQEFSPNVGKMQARMSSTADVGTGISSPSLRRKNVKGLILSRFGSRQMSHSIASKPSSQLMSLSAAPGGTPREIGHLFMSSDEVDGNPLDWALIDITCEDFQNLDRILLDQSFSLELLSIEDGLVEHAISRDNDSDIAVIAISGGRKDLRGFIMKTPTLTNVTSSDSFQELWAVRLDGTMEDGDCGTWVLDAYSGQIYGHIVAGHQRSNIYYMISASSVFGDIIRRLKGFKPESYSRLDNSALIEEVKESQEKRELERINSEKALLATIQKYESRRTSTAPSLWGAQETNSKLPVPSVKGQIKGLAPKDYDTEEVLKRRKVMNRMQAELEEKAKEIAQLNTIEREYEKRIFEYRTQIEADNKLVNEVRSLVNSHRSLALNISDAGKAISGSDPASEAKKTRSFGPEDLGPDGRNENTILDDYDAEFRASTIFAAAGEKRRRVSGPSPEQIPRSPTVGPDVTPHIYQHQRQFQATPPLAVREMAPTVVGAAPKDSNDEARSFRPTTNPETGYDPVESDSDDIDPIVSDFKKSLARKNRG